MAGAADPLQPARDRLRALDLDHEVDGAHVDPQLEARGRDEARDLPRLQQLLDLDPLLARERAVVGARDLLFGELVQAEREPLGEPAVVDEDDRRAVLAHEPEQLGVDGRPDRAEPALGGRRQHAAVCLGHVVVRLAAGLAHVLDGDDDLEVELLARPRVDELDRAVAGDEAADLLQRALRRGEADALHRLREQVVEPLQAERQVRAALRARDGVHLVQDHRLDRAEDRARLRGQHQEEGLGRRDQDVGRRAHDRRPLLLRGVAGADGHAQLRAEAGERPAQVPLDVVVQRLQRRDVEEPQARTGRLREPVDPVEEGRERLARAGRRLDQDVAAGGDRGPAGHLRRGRAGERTLEPFTRLR